MRLSHPSPNFGERRDGARPSLVVIHYTAMESAGVACARLCDVEAEVSAHYLVDYDGTVFSLVEETARAWHAGAGQWRGITDVNSHSIGIESAVVSKTSSNFLRASTARSGTTSTPRSRASGARLCSV